MLPDVLDLAPSTIGPVPRHYGLSEHGDLVLALLECQQPQDFAPTCYGPDGKLLPNDEDLRLFCKSLFAELVDPVTAKRLAKELEEAEAREEAKWRARN